MRGIAASRSTGPADLDTAVAEAFQAFDRFIETWVGTGAHSLAFDSADQARVRDAILTVAKSAHRDRIIGHAVFKAVYNADYKSRMEHQCVSPVFEEPTQPANALAGFRARREGHFQILAVVEPL